MQKIVVNKHIIVVDSGYVDCHQQKTDAEDHCRQAYHCGRQRIRGYAKQRVELDSLSTDIGGLSTVVAQFVDRRNSSCRQWFNLRIGSVQSVNMPLELSTVAASGQCPNMIMTCF